MKTPVQRPYRIGIDARFFRSETAGIGRYTRELIHHLAALDQYNQYVIFLTPKDFPEWTLNQPNFEVRVVDIPIYSVSEQTALLKELRAAQLDLVHFLNFNHPLLYTGPFITTFHDLTLLFYSPGRNKKSLLRRQAFKAVIRHSVQAAKRVIAISEYTAHDAEKHLKVPHAKMEVIYEGGPEPAELPFGNKAIVQDYLHSREPYFLFLSEWRVHKGIVTLIEAFERFKKQTGLSHKLVLGGKQGQEAQLVREAIAGSVVADDIIAPGFVPEEILPLLYHNAAAFIVPSENEGFGLPPLEALAYDTPVIVANNSSLPEVVGDAGLYFPTRDSAALAARMEEVVGNPDMRADLKEKGQQQLRKFSWAKMAQQTLHLYMSVLERGR